MEITGQDEDFRPLGGRTPGGADFAVAVDETLPPLPPLADDAVVVGVVDTGMVTDADAHNPWFGDHVHLRGGGENAIGVGARAEDGFLAPADGHGTFVSGLILAEAPTARIEMWGVLDQGGEGDALTEFDDRAVSRAVEDLISVPSLQVVNLSFGGGFFRNPRAAGKLERAIATLLDAGVAVVAAAGNDGEEQPVWPAAFAGVIGVGALDAHRALPRGGTPPLASFTNTGGHVRAFAEGVQVLGPFVTHRETGDQYPNVERDRRWAEGQHPGQEFRGWARWSGTSFAAAIVSGRIAQYVVEHGGSGTDAADSLLQDAPIVNQSGVWVRRRS